MEIDDTTGLPALPEGYWWGVRKIEAQNDWQIDFIAVGILHKVELRTYWRNKPTGKFKNDWLVYKNAYWDKFQQSEDPRKFISNMADKLYDEAEKLWRAEAQADTIESLLGDYPPNSLKD